MFINMNPTNPPPIGINSTQEAGQSLLDSRQVGERLHLTARQVTILAARGDIRAIKIGRQWLVSEDDLQDYLDEKANRPRRKRRSRAA